MYTMEKLVFSPVDNYKRWLSVVSFYYGIPEKDILKVGKKNIYDKGIRKIFFILCLKDNINLYSLSLHLGFSRCAIRKSIIEFKLSVTDEVYKILKEVVYVKS